MQRFQALGIELILCKIIPMLENVRQIGDEIIAPMHGRSGTLPLAS
jgi:hypothetical protein